MDKNKLHMTSSLEDYLEAILMLSQKSKSVRLTDVAEQLNVSKPSVNRAVNTLTENGFLEHITYGDIMLTPEGESYAADVLRRHKLLKRFLMKTLGVPEDIAEIDACRMEHDMSPITIDKLYEYLERQG